MFEFLFLKLEKKCSKFWVLKIAGKTYTSILVPLFRSEKDLVLLVMPTVFFDFMKTRYILQLMSPELVKSTLLS